MTIKYTALCLGVLLASFSLQGAYNAYGHGPTPPPTFSGPGVPPPPSYLEAINAQPYAGPPAYQPAHYGESGEQSRMDRLCATLSEYSTTQLALGSVATIAALYGMYRTGAGVYASRAAFKHTLAAGYHISWLTGSAVGYVFTQAGAILGAFPAVSGAAMLGASVYARLKFWGNVSPE